MHPAWRTGRNFFTAIWTRTLNITVRSYRYLIGLSDYSARKDLAALVASGRLVKGGSRLFAIYTLPKEEDTGIPQPLVVDSNLPG